MTARTISNYETARIFLQEFVCETVAFKEAEELDWAFQFDEIAHPVFGPVGVQVNVTADQDVKYVLLIPALDIVEFPPTFDHMARDLAELAAAAQTMEVA